MGCNYFRVFVVILAAFCAFFAYICRLNLSLTIERMVTDTNRYDSVEFTDGQLNYVDTFKIQPFIQTEEHTLSRIFQATLISYLRQSTNKSRRLDFSNKHKKLRELKSLHPLNKELPVSLDFDIAVGRQNETKSNNTSNNSTDQVHTANPNVKLVEETQELLLNWDEKQRNTLLLSFFVGYVVFQIPLARAAEIFGPKSLFLVAGFGASFCSLIFPFAARVSEGILVACLVRILMGATQSALFPASYVLICEWMPTNERSKWLPYPASLGRVGTIVMNLITPPLLINYGWQFVFYVSGFMALVWCIIFMIFGSSSPNDSHWISNRELIYIETHKEPKERTMTEQQEITASGFSINEAEKKPSVSWRRLATNKALFILAIVMFSSEWSNMLLLVKLPGFLDRALKFDLQEIGLWGSVLVGIFCVQYPLSSYAALKLEATSIEWLTPLRVRKIFEVSAQVMQGVGCLMIAFYSDKLTVISGLILMMFGRGTVGGGQCLIPPELSKEYTGTVFAYANTIANTAGILGPEVVTLLVDNQENHKSWFSLWVLSASLFFFAGLIFFFFADNSKQDYGKKPKLSIGATSETNLTAPKDPREIFKMEAFSRVSSGKPKQTEPHMD